MHENERKRLEDLRAETKRVRTEANSLRDKIKDEQTKSHLVAIFHTLDDMDSFWLSGSESHAPWWYDTAEDWLRWAARKVRDTDAELFPPGGPPKIYRG